MNVTAAVDMKTVQCYTQRAVIQLRIRGEKTKYAHLTDY